MALLLKVEMPKVTFRLPQEGNCRQESCDHGRGYRRCGVWDTKYAQNVTVNFAARRRSSTKKEISVICQKCLLGMRQIKDAKRAPT